MKIEFTLEELELLCNLLEKMDDDCNDDQGAIYDKLYEAKEDHPDNIDRLTNEITVLKTELSRLKKLHNNQRE